MYLFKRKGVYYVEYFDEYQKKIRRVSTKAIKKQAALIFLSDLKERIIERPQLDYITLSAYHAKYLQYVKDNLSPSYSKIVDLAFRQLTEYTGNIPLTKLHYLQLENFITESFKRTKEGTRTAYIALKSAFNKGKAWNYLEVNHFEKIKLPKIPKNNPLFLKEDEFENISNYETNSKLREIYQFAFFTGLRLSEIINLKWTEVDIVGESIRVRNTEGFITKSKRERVIPMNTVVKKILTKKIPKVFSLDKNNYVFNKNGVRLNGDYITKSFKRCILKSNINPKIHFHNLRHSFASNMASKGVSIFIIKELLGHQDVRTTQIYSHLRQDDLRRAVNILNK